MPIRKCLNRGFTIAALKGSCATSVPKLRRAAERIGQFGPTVPLKNESVFAKLSRYCSAQDYAVRQPTTESERWLLLPYRAGVEEMSRALDCEAQIRGVNERLLTLGSVSLPVEPHCVPDKPDAAERQRGTESKPVAKPSKLFVVFPIGRCGRFCGTRRVEIHAPADLHLRNQWAGKRLKCRPFPAPLPRCKSGTFYFAENRKSLLCVDNGRFRPHSG